MFKHASALLATTLLFCVTSAQSADYRFDFSATGSFVSWTGISDPESVVGGSMVFSAPSFYEVPTSLKSVSLALDGHNYIPAEIGILDMEVGYGGFLAGGILSGVNGEAAGSNDFYFYMFPGTHLGTFTYTSSKRPGAIWSSSAFTYTYTEVSAVPEADTYAMLLAGLGLVGVMLQARKRRQTATLCKAPLNSTRKHGEIGVTALLTMKD